VHPILFRIGAVLIPAYGALTALGVLAALALTQATARVARVDPHRLWNLCVAALIATLAGQRLFLALENWSVLQKHPSWIFELAMLHHPLVATAGAAAGVAVGAVYARRRKLPFRAAADALAAPLALGLAFEQAGALAAGSGYGVDAGPGLRWAVTYTSAVAARWSGTPLGVPLHPVQAYAALAFLTLAILLLVWLPARRQEGDAAGVCLMGLGVAIYLTEIWRDTEGRGVVLRGAIDGPQIAAVAMVLAGALILRERKSRIEAGSFPPISPKDGEMDGAQGKVLPTGAPTGNGDLL
jgi:phosphatidylglycerol---prolipoprotein diacylglyceryl transferase